MITLTSLLDTLGALPVIDILIQQYQLFTVIWGTLRYLILIATRTSDLKYCNARYGVVGILLQLSGILRMEGARKHHWNINMWTDEEVLAWKSAYVSSCSAIAVAGAIFASVGLAGLQLPNMNQINWTARAFMSSSMVLGILSVTFATSQQQELGMLINPLEVRLWLSRGKPDLTSSQYRKTFFRILPLESSVSTQMMIALPRLLLRLAVFLYLIGFGLFLLLQWLEHVPKRDTGLRNIFIVFVVTVCVFCLYEFVISVWNLIDERKRNKEFKVKKDYYEGTADLNELQTCLDRVKGLKDLINQLSSFGTQQPPANPDEAANYIAVTEKLKELDDILTRWRTEQTSTQRTKIPCAEAANSEKHRPTVLEEFFENKWRNSSTA